MYSINVLLIFDKSIMYKPIMRTAQESVDTHHCKLQSVDTDHLRMGCDQSLCESMAAGAILRLRERL